jgi:hypothetical protein
MSNEVGRVQLAQALRFGGQRGVVSGSIVSVGQGVDHKVDVARLGLRSFETSEGRAQRCHQLAASC